MNVRVSTLTIHTIFSRELPEKKEQQEKPIKKRRTLHSIRENTTLFNATSSIFQVKYLTQQPYPEFHSLLDFAISTK